MSPLVDVTLHGVRMSAGGSGGALDGHMGFRAAASSYNGKMDAWEPLVESWEGFLRLGFEHRIARFCAHSPAYSLIETGIWDVGMLCQVSLQRGPSQPGPACAPGNACAADS